VERKSLLVNLAAITQVLSALSHLHAATPGKSISVKQMLANYFSDGGLL